MLGLVTVAAAFTALDSGSGSAQPAPAPTPITISSTVPVELNVDGGGAPHATLDQAAAFAWQEFIALNWPAKQQTGAVADRDTPAADCLFGGVPNPNAPTPGTDCAARPLTWETFRGKAEIFTNGATQNYDTPPTYADLYANPQTGNPEQLASCTGAPPPAQAAWVNLDETTQIFEDAMYAGAAPASAPNNSAPQLIRFLAKANRAEFNYYNALGGASGVAALRRATLAYITTGDPLPGSVNYVSLPNNTIEIKAGWRALTADEAASGRFHTARVRYYEQNAENQPCWNEAVWGLVALHIIQKTASAPYFIYATFEQADNIQTAGGQPVEDENGATVGTPPCDAADTAACTTPSLVFNDTPVVNPPSYSPPNVTLSPADAPYCTEPGSRLYYRNLLTTALPTGGPICVNYRYNPIPPVIIAANQRAHAAITAFNQANGIPSSPWLFYKLVNVQYLPLNNDPPGLYPGNDPTTGANRASFYLANIVVETNRPLQLFTGSLVQGNPGTGSNSEYESQFTNGGTGTHRNVYYRGVGHNMGGCMGCHGAQGQAAGGDFSVILARGLVGLPEAVPQPPPPSGSRR